VPGSAGGSLPGVEAGRGAGVAPAFALSPGGDVMIAWHYAYAFRAPDPSNIRDEGCCEGIRAVVLTRDGRFGKPIALAPRGMNTALDGIAILSPSRFAAVFTASTEDGPRGQFERLGRAPATFGARHSIGVGLGYSVLDVSFVGSTLRVLYRTGTAADLTIAERLRGPHGYGRERRVFHAKDFSAGLQFFDDPSGGQVVAGHEDVLTRRAGERFRSQRIPLVGYGYPSTLAAASNGAAAMVWPLGDGATMVSTRQPGRRFGRPVVISRQRPGSQQPQAIAVDRAGRATVVWSDRLVVTSRTGKRVSVEPTPVPGPFGAVRDDRGRGTIVGYDHAGKLWAAYGS
jgi:hypothetical protein